MIDLPINLLKSPKIHLNVVESTNDYAGKYAQDTDFIEGTIIWADFQTAGKGHFGSSWFSSPQKNLLLSCLLKPTWLPIEKMPLLNMVISISVAETLQDFISEKIEIKWPNDILLNQKKIAGILIQNSIKLGKFSSSIVGIGINVNEPSFPDHLPQATSLFIASKKKLDREKILEQLLFHLNRQYNLLHSGAVEDIIQSYHSKLYGLNRKLVFNLPKGPDFIGKIIKVDTDGKLHVTMENGNTQSFAHKEIHHDLGTNFIDSELTQ